MRVRRGGVGRKRTSVVAEGKDDLAWTRDRELIRKASSAIRRHLNKRKKCDVKFNSQRAAAKQQSCERPRCEERRQNGNNK